MFNQPLYDQYLQLRQTKGNDIDTFLKNVIQNYQAQKYDQIQEIELFKKMINDYASQELKDSIKFGQIDNLDTTGDNNMRKFHSYLRELAEGIYNKLKDMEDNKDNLSFPAYMASFEKQISEKRNKKLLNQCKDADYFILKDDKWKDIYSDLVLETKGFNQDGDNFKTKLNVNVTFKSIEAKNIFNKICVQSLHNLKIIDQDAYLSPNLLSEIVRYKKETLLKIIFANFIIFRSTTSQKNLFQDQEELLNLQKLTSIKIDEYDEHLVKQNNPYQLLPQDITIELKRQTSPQQDKLVRFMQLLIKNKEYDYISYHEYDQFDQKTENSNSNEFTKLEYFMTYFAYYKELDGDEQQSRYAFVPEKILNDGLLSMQKSCFGLEGFLQNCQMKSLLEEFQNPLRFYECKGPLIYGPPGTGKTYIIQKMTKHFQMHSIFDGNSSNFQTSLQGQGSRLLTYYFNQARAIPWQPCAVHIGEIEQLVMKKGNDNKSSEVLNKLLELTDGTETVGNVKIFSTTNHIEMIEEAILSRFRQIYLGKSNTALRRDWIVWYLLSIKQQNYEEFKKIMSAFFQNVDGFLQSSQNEQKEQLRKAIKDIVNYTINFSTRQLKSLMCNITSKIQRGYITLQSTKEQKLKHILDFCKSLGEDNFMFGNRSLPQLMFDSNDHNQFSEQLKQDFLAISSQPLNGQNLQRVCAISQAEGFQKQMKMLEEEEEDELNEGVVQQLNAEKFEYSKVIFIDKSTISNERINILMQKSRISENMFLYEKAENIYHKLEVLIQSHFKCKKLEESKKSLKDLQDEFNSFLQQFYKKYNSKKQFLHPQEILEFLKKYEEDTSKIEDDFDELRSANEYECIESILDNFQNKTKVVWKEVLKLITTIRSDFEQYQNHTKFKLLNKKLINIISTLSKDNDQIDPFSLLKDYNDIIYTHAKDLSAQLQKIISSQQLEEKTIEELIKQKKIYQLQFCNLYDSSTDNIMMLLAEFIKNGDFSKVDMVDYHSCERNNARDLNSFKNYISNLTKEGREEEKSLIVYNLDEILDVTLTLDSVLEKDKQQMAIKIFQTINTDTLNSNLWTIFIARNTNVIDLFYSIAAFWPKQSRKGKLHQIQQEKLQQVQCSLCENLFKECDEEDKCKAHLESTFYIENDIDRFKKFQGDWYGSYLDEYYKKQKHVKEHKNDFSKKDDNQINMLSDKGCTYCVNEQKLFCNYDRTINHLEESSFNILKKCSILPQQFQSFQNVMSLKTPITLEEVTLKIKQGKLSKGDVKRVCCQGDFYKEECNPHRHIKQQAQNEDSIKKELHEFIKKWFQK